MDARPSPKANNAKIVSAFFNVTLRPQLLFQYTEQMTLNMVNFVEKENIAQEDSEDDDVETDELLPKNVCVDVRCPICLSWLAQHKVTQELASGKKVNYYAISSFQRHINAHMQKVKDTSAKKKATKKSGQKKSIQRGVKSTNRRQNADDSELDTTTESDDDIDIEVEMQRNFERESSESLSDMNEDTGMTVKYL